MVVTAGHGTETLLSVGGSFYARTILGSPINDLTAGFKGFRGEALAKLPVEDLHTDGYGFQIEVTTHLIHLGCRVMEMPIRFVDRQLGKSKMSSGIALEAINAVWRIRSEMRRKYH